MNRISLIVIGFSMLFAFSSCKVHNDKTFALKIGINDWTGYDPFIIADSIGLFAKNDVSTQIVRFQSSQEAIASFREGTIQGAALTLDEAVSLLSSGFPLKAVLVIDYSLGGDMILGQEGLTEVSQLEGKRVGYEGSVVGEFLLYRALNIKGIYGSSMELINIPANEWKEAFKMKKVDALVCYNPLASTLIEKEKANVLFSSSDIPFQIIDVLVFSESFYERHKDVLAKITKSWFEALEFQHNNQEQAMNMIMKIKSIDSIDYSRSMDGLEAPDLETNKLLFKPESEQNIFKYSQSIINFMLLQGLVHERINTADLFADDILNSIEHSITTKYQNQ